MQVRQHSRLGTVFDSFLSLTSLKSSPLQGKQDAPPHKRFVDEMIRCIDVAADFEDGLGLGEDVGRRRTWVAIKMACIHATLWVLVT